MQLRLPTLYIVVTDFAVEGIGSAGDATDSIDSAYDQYVEALDSDQPARAFKLIFDVENNTFETAREITDQLEEMRVAICKERGIELEAA